MDMKVGLLSDTHGYVDKKIYEYFRDCDEIWHAGDIGEAQVADELAAFKPFRAVYGNIDSKDVQIRFPEDLKFTCEGLHIWITHIGGVPPNYNPRVKKLLMMEAPDIFICGHSHVLRIMRDPKFQNMLYVNPGAAGNHGFHKIKTLVRFDLTNKVISNLEVIEIGKRGAMDT